MLFATHYLEEADQYADRIVLISKGRIVADGTGSEIKALAAGRTVRATLGTARPRGAGPARRRRVGRGPRRHRAGARQGHRRRWPATCSPRPTPATWRSPPRGIEDAFLSLTGDTDDRPDPADDTDHEEAHR